MKIQITTKSKINNPIDNNDNFYSFEADFNENLFLTSSEQYQFLKTQKDNMEKLSKILAEKNLYLSYIWMGTFKNYSDSNANNFVIRTNINENSEQVYWRKYATKSIGSGQNHLYIIKNDKFEKVQLSRILSGEFQF